MVYGKMHNYKVIGFTGKEIILSHEIYKEIYPVMMPVKNIGKTVFLTREEAEAKLAELEVTGDE